jgi:hypothetical protein
MADRCQRALKSSINESKRLAFMAQAVDLQRACIEILSSSSIPIIKHACMQRKRFGTAFIGEGGRKGFRGGRQGRQVVEAVRMHAFSEDFTVREQADRCSLGEHTAPAT